MQRQLKGGTGVQEMMKAMMQGQGGDQLDMEEMESKYGVYNVQIFSLTNNRNDVANGRPRRSWQYGRIGRIGRWDDRYV